MTRSDPLHCRAVDTWQVHDGEVSRYISYALPDERLMEKYRILSIDATVVAHDQGWSSYDDDHGERRVGLGRTE